MLERLANNEPPRVRLANTPTRGHWLRYGEQLGAKIWVKRDDHTGSELSGNKVRKLEYLMAEALAAAGDPRHHVRRRAIEPRARDRDGRGPARPARAS